MLDVLDKPSSEIRRTVLPNVDLGILPKARGGEVSLVNYRLEPQKRVTSNCFSTKRETAL